MPTRLISALIIVLATTLLFGCGGDEDPSQPATATVAATTAAEQPSLPEPISTRGAKRLDLSDLIEAEHTSAEEPDWLVTGFGSVWAKQGSGDVLRVDPQTGELVTEIGERKPGERPPGGHLCQGLGVSDDAIWSCSQLGTIARIDPRTNEVAATVKLDNLGDQGRLVSAADHVWVLTDDGAALTGIDTATNKPTTTIELGGRCGDLAADGATVYAMCPLKDRLLRIDAEAGEVDDELELPGAGNASVSEDLWVGFEGGVAQIDPDSLEVLAVYDLAPRYGGAIYATRDSVWVRVEGGPFLAKIDPDEQRIVATIESPRLKSGGDVIEARGRLWASAYDDLALVQLRVPTID